ncbi:MAG TPA: hypothetical protein VN577_16310 [Terriglobales bacterium]|nr:hypothetical protein [Terriglobales bacterium]
MKVAVRILGILLALFLLVGSIADILGLLPHSGRMPSAMFRFRLNFVPIVTGILLLVNYRKIKGSARKFIYFVTFLAVNLWYSLLEMRMVAGFFSGAKSYHVLPTALFFMAILWGTFWLALNHHFGKARRST